MNLTVQFCYKGSWQEGLLDMEYTFCRVQYNLARPDSLEQMQAQKAIELLGRSIELSSEDQEMQKLMSTRWFSWEKIKEFGPKFSAFMADTKNHNVLSEESTSNSLVPDNWESVTSLLRFLFNLIPNW